MKYKVLSKESEKYPNITPLDDENLDPIFRYVIDSSFSDKQEAENFKIAWEKETGKTAKVLKSSNS